MTHAIPSIKIDILHTLGPSGTNCEQAAKEWFRRQNITDGKVVLHNTLEEAVPYVISEPNSALLGCIAYPDLHTLIFTNIQNIVLTECFVMPTFNMVLASQDGSEPNTVAMHPAPQGLVGNRFKKQFVDSNAAAAISCKKSEAEGCITTLPAAMANDLCILEDFGPVPMGFSIHIPIIRTNE